MDCIFLLLKSMISVGNLPSSPKRAAMPDIVLGHLQRRQTRALPIWAIRPPLSLRNSPLKCTNFSCFRRAHKDSWQFERSCLPHELKMHFFCALNLHTTQLTQARRLLNSLDSSLLRRSYAFECLFQFQIAHWWVTNTDVCSQVQTTAYSTCLRRDRGF